MPAVGDAELPGQLAGDRDLRRLEAVHDVALGVKLSRRDALVVVVADKAAHVWRVVRVWRVLSEELVVHAEKALAGIGIGDGHGLMVCPLVVPDLDLLAVVRLVGEIRVEPELPPQDVVERTVLLHQDDDVLDEVKAVGHGSLLSPAALLAAGVGVRFLIGRKRPRRLVHGFPCKLGESLARRAGHCEQPSPLWMQSMWPAAPPNTMCSRISRRGLRSGLVKFRGQRVRTAPRIAPRANRDAVGAPSLTVQESRTVIPGPVITVQKSSTVISQFNITVQGSRIGIFESDFTVQESRTVMSASDITVQESRTARSGPGITVQESKTVRAAVRTTALQPRRSFRGGPGARDAASGPPRAAA